MFCVPPQRLIVGILCTTQIDQELEWPDDDSAGEAAAAVPSTGDGGHGRRRCGAGGGGGGRSVGD